MYSKKVFVEIRAGLQKHLLDAGTKEALICDLYTCKNAPGAVSVEFADGSTALHVAEACNVAAVINSLDRLLALPRSNIACEELSEIVLLRLDVLREYIRDLLPKSSYSETKSEELIRFWAGFLKHPRGFVLAHRCIHEWGEIKEVLLLDAKEVKDFSKVPNKEKDKAKDKYKNKAVKVVLPTVDEIETFFRACSKNMAAAIELYA